jgi:hypothetical protein
VTWWALQRVKDPEKWRNDLDRPIGSTKPTEAELARDAESFDAFASAFGISRPNQARA